MQDATLNAASKVLRLTRAGETVWGTLPGDDWSVFDSNHSTYEPLSWARNLTDTVDQNEKSPLLTTVVQVSVNFGFGGGVHHLINSLRKCGSREDVLCR